MYVILKVIRKVKSNYLELIFQCNYLWHSLTIYFCFYAPGDDSPHGGILLLLCPYVRMYVRTYVRTYVRVWLKFLVKVLYWFKLYLMPSKHFRWTVYMLNFDIKINLDEFYF